MLIKLKVTPNAKTEEVIKITDDFFKIKITTQPEKGQANKKVISLLSKYFKIPKSGIQIAKGKKNREKLVEIINGQRPEK